MCEICSKLTIKLQERRQWHLSGVFVVNFERIYICKVLESFYKLLLQDVLLSVNITGVAILVIFFCFTRIWYLVKLNIEELFKIIYELNCI